MRDSKKFSHVSNEIQQDYKPQLVKGRTGWVVKGLVYASLVGVGLMGVNVVETQAAEWTPNTAETIRAKIKEGDTSYTFVEGDTFYEIGRAINVKYTVLMELNGFAEGTQYTVPVGTTITFDGRKVTLTDKDGNVVNEKILSDDAKVDKSQPFMNQKSDTIKGTSVTTNNQSTSTNNGGNSGKPNPVQPVTPVKPIKPTDPTIPVKPVDPKPEENRLAELKKQLAELEAQLANKQAELENAIARLNEANAQNRENSIILANAQITVNNLNDELVVAESAVVSAQNTVSEAQAAIDAWQPTEEETEMPNSLVEALNVAQSELAAAQANKETIINEKIAAEQALEEAKQLPMVDTAVILEEIAIINNEINNLQQKIDEVKAEIAKLEGNTKPTEDAKLEEARQSALNTLATLNLLPEEMADFTAVIQSAQSIEEINDYLAQAQLAHDKNEAIENESKELKAAKANAINQLDEMNLGSEDKEILSYQINNAISVEEINDILANAKSISDENDKKEEAEKLKLEAAKSDAKKEIVTLNLTDEEQATFISLVDNAKTVVEVSDALENARQVSEQNNQNEQSQLEKAKKEAIDSLVGLNLKDSEKTEFINQIENAQTIAEINSILKEAEATSNKNDEAASEKELSEAKIQAKSDLAKMNLTQTQYTEFEKQIDEATTVSSINVIVANAQKASDKNDVEAANAEKLAKAKEQAKQEVNGLEYLPQTNKDAINKSIDNAKTIAEINEIVANAKTLDEQFKNDAEAAKKLEETRQAALKELEGLNLKGNTSFEEQIKAATTEAEITAALDAAKAESAKNDKEENEAKELEKAKQDAIAELDKLNLTDTERRGFTTQINNAKTTQEVGNIMTEARKAAEANDNKKMATVTFIITDQFGNEIDRVVMDVEAGAKYDFTLEDLGLDSSYTVLRGTLKGTAPKNEGGNKNVMLVVQGAIVKDDAEQQQIMNDKFTENVNELRQENGLAPIEQNDVLNEAANIRAKELAESFDHTRPDGSGFSTVMKDVDGGNMYVASSENIIYGNYGNMSGENAGNALFNEWNNSQGHHDNLLDPDATSYGLGWYYDEETGRTYVVFISGYDRY